MASHHIPESVANMRNVPEAYRELDDLNTKSWYIQGPEDGSKRPFDVYTSVRTLGAPRLTNDEVDALKQIPLADRPEGFRHNLHRTRKTLIGNMSESWSDRAPAAEVEAAIRVLDANEHVNQFLGTVALTPEDTFIMYPRLKYRETLAKVNVDALKSEAQKGKATWLSEKGDFIYTHDKEVNLAFRPADCPGVFAYADTPDGPIFMLTHFAWEGAAEGYVDDMFEHFDELGVDRDSLRLYVTGGAQAESFPFSNEQDPRERFPVSAGLFKNIHKEVAEDGKTTYTYSVDTPRFVYDELIKHGLKPEQIFSDTSDTSRRDSGYSSHGRAFRSDPNTPYYDGSARQEINGRDIIIGSWR